MKIAIANDLPIAVEALRRVLSRNSKHQIVWVAKTGTEAVQRCQEETPDLILMDLVMPEMDGVEATRRIMRSKPCAIVIVASTIEGASAKVFEAMGAGALDAVSTPVFSTAHQVEGADSLLAKIDIIGRLIGADQRSQKKRITLNREGAATPDCLVAVGASAGGPAALASILGHLPSDFPAAFVIIQHVDEQFATGLVDWLSQHSSLRVRLAKAGERPTPSTVLVAGTSDHLVLTQSGIIKYTAEPRACSYRPSADVFFNSVAVEWRGPVAGVLLSGMGRDGAKGLKALRMAGHFTIAQDRASSAVYGMPKAAAEIGAAVEIVPLNRIAERLAAWLAAPWSMTVETPERD